MQIFESASDLISHLKELRRNASSIGFVPTMGALHQGHLSLFEKSKAENDTTVGSIFVNPLQFNNSSDLSLYPRPIDKDMEMLHKAGCNILFLPSSEEMYPLAPALKMSFGPLEESMEGRYRPGHFAGVGLVVAKFFNIIRPDKAYFGQKDLQQFSIIRQMVQDLSFNIQLRCCPIVREENGLAMSSRNARLSRKKRHLAPALYASLQLAKKYIESDKLEELEAAVKEFFLQYPDLKIDYFEVVDSETLTEVKDVKKHQSIAICVAAYLEEVRLIDNLVFEPTYTS